MNNQDIKVWINNNKWLRSLAQDKNIDQFIQDNYEYLVEFIQIQMYGANNGTRNIKRTSGTTR